MLQIMKMYKKKKIRSVKKGCQKFSVTERFLKKSHFKSVDMLTLKGFQEFLDKYCK